MGWKVKTYTVKANETVSGDVAKIIGVEPGVKAGVNIVAFLIEGGVVMPEDLPSVDDEVKELTSKIDTSKPTIITGRGPHWLYGVFVHNLHFVNVLAVWEPRAKAGVVVEALTKELLGKGVTVDGNIIDVEVGGRGTGRLSYGVVGGKGILHFEIVGDKAIEPAEMLKLQYPTVETDKPLIIEGMMPIWLGARLFTEYVHKVPAIGFYDPRLVAGVVSASHTPDIKVGQLIEVKAEDVEVVAKRKSTKIVGVLGDPNSGKSVFLHILNDVLRAKGLQTLTQEADITAPTQHWSLYVPEVRKELKKIMNPEERLDWIIDSLRNAKVSGSVDVVLVDIGGGRPDLNQRITRDNLAILHYVDGVVVVSRNDKKQIGEWLRELKTYLPGMKIYGVLESRLEGEAEIRSGYGVITHLDRKLYVDGKIPQKTVKVVEKVADRILSDEHYIAGDINVKTAKEKLEDFTTAGVERKILR